MAHWPYRSNANPMLVADEVLAAFEAAERNGLPPSECYRAGVNVWRRAYPDQPVEHAGKQGVEIILKTKGPPLPG